MRLPTPSTAYRASARATCRGLAAAALAVPVLLGTAALAQTGTVTGSATNTSTGSSTLPGTSTGTGSSTLPGLGTSTLPGTGTGTGSNTLGGTGTNTGTNPGGRPPGSGINPPGTTPGQPTPLAFDVAGLGAPAFAPQPVVFDIFGDGKPRSVRWPARGFAWLVLDLNEDGKITSGRELFGDSTSLSDVGSEQDLLATQGFEALAQYDADRNGAIDRRDPIFRRLRLWSDLDLDGKSQPEELRTLASHGVRRISLSYTPAAMADGTPLLLGSWERLIDGKAEPVRGLLVDFFLQIVE